MIYNSKDLKADYAIGGKGKGLLQLSKMGFNVPEFLIITPEGQSEFLKSPENYLNGFLDGPKAIRSSGMKEDGENHSFAGQFETFLNVRGIDSIADKVKACIDSANNERVREYSTLAEEKSAHQIAVIIQDMVDAKAAGVAFSSDPISNRRDLQIINIVEGLGDKLVDGKVEPESIQLSAFDDRIPESKLISKENLKKLRSGLLKLRNELKCEVDVEFAFGQNDELFWLQVRPITTLSPQHPNELDSIVHFKDEILTRANIGEMMPGYLSPLSISTFGRAIEYGIQDFYMQCGVQKEIIEDYLYIKYFYNHGFISLSGLYRIADSMLLPKNEYIDYSILGRSISKPSPWPKKSFFIQFRNQLKQFKYLGKAKKTLLKLEAMANEFSVLETNDPMELIEWIDQQLPRLNEAYSHHYNTSAKSGSQYAALISVISGGPKPTPESNTLAAKFLINIEGIVGADSINQIKNLARLLTEHISEFEQLNDDALLNAIITDRGELKRAYDKFIKDHGHRCVREAEMKEKDWSQEPIKLIPVIRNIAKVGDFSENQVEFDMKETLKSIKNMNRLKKAIIKKLAKSVREAVKMREESKSAAIKFQQQLKFAYINLSKLLVEKGLVADQDSIFYLRHSEIMSLVSGQLKEAKQIVEQRKQFDQLYLKMTFQEVYFGHPYPTNRVQNEGDNIGTVVSQGKVKGKIKIVRSLEEADKLEKGDIMVCQYTDIGWSPYFAIIGGIITEIGSPLSHGAVVAREYGIPAIVNMQGAMEHFKDGEEVLMDTSSDNLISRLD